jgi:NitT/TauT family transport system substrate-binding protein
VGCCDKPFSLSEPPESGVAPPLPPVDRRSLLKGAAAGVIAAASVGNAGAAQAAAGKHIKLAFCSQLLCVVPYEVARAGGHFGNAGLDVELVYTRGGNAAMQALVGGAVDYAATSLDVALQAYGHGADIRRFATTGRLPLFALATAPKRAAEIKDIADLKGRTVGVSALGNADHALLLNLLRGAGVAATQVQFATLGPNLLEALRQGQVDAGLVQEPALTLVEKAGGRVLVNAMNNEDAQKYLGGPYEFMGVAVRTTEIPARRDEMTALAGALQAALRATRAASPEDLAKALPRELTAGADMGELRDVLGRYRDSLYPTEVAIDLSASNRVAETLKTAGLLKPDTDTSGLYDTSIAARAG